MQDPLTAIPVVLKPMVGNSWMIQQQIDIGFQSLSNVALEREIFLRGVAVPSQQTESGLVALFKTKPFANDFYLPLILRLEAKFNRQPDLAIRRDPMRLISFLEYARSQG